MLRFSAVFSYLFFIGSTTAIRVKSLNNAATKTGEREHLSEEQLLPAEDIISKLKERGFIHTTSRLIGDPEYVRRPRSANISAKRLARKQAPQIF